jgi:hypothetical protein
MSEALSNLSTPLTQALTSLHFQEIIEHYRTSERGDFRVIAALLTIQRENAEVDLEAAAAADLEAVGVDLVAVSVARRTIRAKDRAPLGRTIPKPTAQRRAIDKPIRSTRARAAHSHGSHGGAHKAVDDGGGQPPPPHSGVGR